MYGNSCCLRRFCVLELARGEQFVFMYIPLVISSIRDDADRSFMEQLYVNHERLMIKNAYVTLGSQATRENVEDIVSAACLGLIGKIEKLIHLDENALRAYVGKTVTNKAISLLRSQGRMSGCLQPIEDQDTGERVEDQIMDDVDITALQKALALLSDVDHDILTRTYFENSSSQEIAEELGMKDSAVRKRVSRAKAKAKIILKDLMTDE